MLHIGLPCLLLSGRSMKYCTKSKWRPVVLSYLMRRNEGLCFGPVAEGILYLQGVTDGATYSVISGRPTTEDAR